MFYIELELPKAWNNIFGIFDLRKMFEKFERTKFAPYKWRCTDLSKREKSRAVYVNALQAFSPKQSKAYKVLSTYTPLSALEAADDAVVNFLDVHSVSLFPRNSET